ncbi:hypothetical protein GCM10009788_48220 [Nocardioides humi]|uniref:Adenylate kinase n=1 Tax=Nocardioides humi TaxID=449461 RepID=A0ABN2BGC0_9ACTN
MRRVDRPTPLPDGAKLLHIGPPKTGTSALQAAFHAARESLEAQGVHYVSRSANPLGLARSVALGRLASAPPRYQRRWDQVSRAFRSSPARHAILSSEGFCAASAETAADIATALGPDVHVLITLRPMTGLLPSIWQQITREGNTDGYLSWLEDVLPATGPGHAMMRDFDPAHLLSVWGSAFGEDRVIFLCGDPRDRTAHLDATSELLGAPGALTLQPVRNASPSFAEIEVLRHANLARAAAGAVASAGPWQKVMRKAGRELGDHPTTSGGERVRLPRWAVERSNERTRRAVAALAASDALVVGDPEHLLADPQRYDAAVAVPTHVSVAVAGHVADVVARQAVAEFGEPAARRIRGLESRAALVQDAPAAPDGVPAREVVSTLVRRVVRRG